MAGFGNYGMQFSQERQMLQSSMFVSYGERKRIIEGSEEDQLRIERKKIKNRASAARSREKKVERMKYLEEKVEELREENAQLDRLIKLMKMEDEEEEEEEEDMEIKGKKSADKLKSLRRTRSSPW